MTEQERYAWIQLALTPYIGADSFLRLLQHYGTAESALRAPAHAIQHIAIKGKQAAAKWYDTTPARAATDAALQWEEQKNCRIMLLNDEDYPMMLTEGITPPPVLFVRGQVDYLHRPAVSVVGSRHATPHALRIAQEFSQALSQQGITIVSGMAAGIDAAAHSGALMGSGSTIAFWGTGIDRIYPSENQALAHEIAEKGLIVSEFPLGTRPLSGNFPRRNRLIAAQSQATLVVEATLKSGSLITARFAAEMGREVMAIPSSIDNVHAKGCHKLIKEGAKLVECIEDIINECPKLLIATSTQQPETLSTKLSTGLPTKLSTTPTEIIHTATTSTPTPLTSTHHAMMISELSQPVDKIVDNSVDNFVNNSISAILEIMGYDPIHPDFIAEKLNIHTDELYAILLECELSGMVAAMSGGRYQRIA